MTSRPLRVFLCHSSNDKPAVRELYQKLRAEPWIQPWLDEEELFPGMDWNMEIEKAIEATDVILVCLSNNSITKEGYIQREIRIALDYADYKPEGTLFIIPVRLEECTPPKRLARWQYADYFEGQREREYERLFVSLRKRSESLGIYSEKIRSPKENGDIIDRLDELISQNQEIARPTNINFQITRNKLTLSNGMEFMHVPAGKFLMGSDDPYHGHKVWEKHEVEVPYNYWMLRYPITNDLYDFYVRSVGIDHPVTDWISKKDHPVVNISKWKDAIAYCQWLTAQYRSEIPSNLTLRLPTEAEWEKAARWKIYPNSSGEALDYPWGNKFDLDKCNTEEGEKNDTTPVGFYSPQGDSPFGCADMAGNVWEWTHSLMKNYPYHSGDGREDPVAPNVRVLRGGSFKEMAWDGLCVVRRDNTFIRYFDDVGFRVCLAPSLTK